MTLTPDMVYIKWSSFSRLLNCGRHRAMKRAAPEARRWESGLRQSACMSDTSTSVRRRSVVESKRSSGNAAATAALRAYLFNDKDARSRVPRSRSAVARADVVNESMAKPKGSRISTESAGIGSENSATAHNAATLGAGSPLSRFQKHVKHVQSKLDHREQPGRKHHGALGRNRDTISQVSAQSLTRSLLDKIQEAKGLRTSETSSKYQTTCHRDLGDRCRSSSPSGSCTEPAYKADFCALASTVALPSPLQSSALTASKNSPPVPHAKPVIPVISTFPPPPQPSSKKTTVEKQHSELDNEVSTPKEPVSTINGAINAVTAALLIQRMWRRKLSHQEQGRELRSPGYNEVTLIIDKRVESVTPLFSAVKAMHQTSDASKARAGDVAAVSAVEGDEVAGLCANMKAAGASFPSYDPWTDHDLIFLEEGRCIGELQEVVRRSTSMAQDELVWKRPQHVIQQLETRRVATIQKTRRKRRKPPQPVETPGATETMGPIERLKESCFETAKTSLTGKTKLRRELKFPHVRLLKYRISKGKVALRAGRAPSETRRLFARVDRARTNLCRVSNNTNQPQAGDVSGSNQADNDMVNGQSDENSQALQTDTRSTPAALDRFVIFSDTTETADASAAKPLRNDLICVGDLALARSLLYEKRHRLSSDIVDHHNDFIPLTPSPSNPPEIEHPSEQVSIEDQLSWHSEKYPQVDMPAREDPAQKYSASLDSTRSYTSTALRTAEHSVAQIQCEYNEEAPQPRCNQLLEAAPIIPVAQLRLDENKRLEFLRALNDFKRCMRPSSCASSTLSLQGSSSLQRAVKCQVLPSDVNIQSEAVDGALRSYGNSDSDL